MKSGLAKRFFNLSLFPISIEATDSLPSRLSNFSKGADAHKSNNLLFSKILRNVKKFREFVEHKDTFVR